jgi:hypothetical protein
MADDRRHIDQLFKDYLSGYKAPAPKGAWERLQAEMQPKKKRMHLMYLRLAAAAILLLIAFSAGYFWSEFKNTDNSTLVSEMPNDIQQEATPENAIQNNSLQGSTAESLENSIPQTSNKQITKTDAGKIESSPLAQDAINPDLESQKQPAFQNEMALSENIEVLAETALPTENIVVITTAEAEKTDELANQIDQDNNTSELEKMSPEMLHQLLVGNDEAYADEIIPKTNKQLSQQWSVGAQFSPVYSYRNLSGDGFSTPDEQVDQDYFNDKENGLMAYAGGISLNYGFNDRLSLASGLYLSRIGQENADVVAYDSPDSPYLYNLASSGGTVTINPQKFEKVMVREIDTTKDSVPGDYIVSGTFVQNLDYLEVPLVIKYKMLQSRFSVNLSGGLSPGILVNNRSYFSVDGEKVQTGYTENIKPVIYNSVMGLGIEYSISTKLSINLDPLFKYSLSPINSNSGIKYHPYSISWFTGITYKL